VSAGPDISAKNRRVAVMASGVAAVMLGMAFAAVPLYTLFCQTTGFGGTTQRAEQAPATASDTIISVRFDANTATDLGWAFHPSATTMSVRVGEPTLATYVAVNNTQADSTGTAVFNVTPPEAGIYFNKIECFCFTEQALKPGQRVEMPVQFFIDPAMLDDLDAKSIREITLSYTFYPVNKKAADEQAALKTN
jgi:cytochrome c oxidase assembly protein subunit 11